MFPHPPVNFGQHIVTRTHCIQFSQHNLLSFQQIRLIRLIRLLQLASHECGFDVITVLSPFSSIIVSIHTRCFTISKFLRVFDGEPAAPTFYLEMLGL